MSPKDSLWRAKAAARKAASLDDLSAQTHVSLCAVAFFADWDWPQALQECDRASELDPKVSEAYHFKAKVFGALQRHTEAVEAAKGDGAESFCSSLGPHIYVDECAAVWCRDYRSAGAIGIDSQGRSSALVSRKCLPVQRDGK